MSRCQFTAPTTIRTLLAEFISQDDNQKRYEVQTVEVVARKLARKGEREMKARKREKINFEFIPARKYFHFVIFVCVLHVCELKHLSFLFIFFFLIL